MVFPTIEEPELNSSIERPHPCRQFAFSEIQFATKNFDESLVIGRGGFGKVYKGAIVNGARLVVAAIKRLESTSSQGAVEFWAEVEMLSKLWHCHLVSLIGYCNEGKEMILVYEYMPHGTLEDHLHKHHTPLSWRMRLKICIGAARGLDYLHTGTGIHHGVTRRDMKSSNILLHKRWAAKISDFGLSKIVPANQPSTYVNTLVKGTFGYLDPDYFFTGKLTRKSDVYAFGVILFENLCGKRAVDRSLDEEQWGLARWAQDSIREGRLKRIVDSNLKGQISPKCLKEFARLANSCLHSHPKQRPAMAEVVVRLESILALQEKTNSKIHPRDSCWHDLQIAEGTIMISGRKVPMFLLPSNSENFGESRTCCQFDFVTIRDATKDFSETIRIGKGGLGSFYRGKLKNGQKIAIMRLHSASINFQRECVKNVLLFVKLEHENLAQLLGYCMEGTSMFLVYEFAIYASLDRLIFDPVVQALLDWNKRYKIIVDVARALLYLHKHAPFQVIHGNVIPANILLNESLDAKLSDIGFIDVDKVRGTSEYMAPEYALHDHLSTKVDVFNFGALVLQTITGQRFHINFFRGNGNLKQYTWRNWLKERASNIIYPTNDDDSSYVAKILHIGLLCIEADPDDRLTMDEVVGMISSSSLALPLPKNPAYMNTIENVR